VIILTLFGTTTGLEVLTIPLSDAPPFNFEESSIGVNPGHLTLRPNTEAVVVFRRSVGDRLATWVAVYRHAREIGYDRPGCFYGAGAWIIDSVVNENLLAKILREMASQIQALAMNGDRFIKKIADVKDDFTWPVEIASLIKSLTKINSGLESEGESAFIVERANPIDVVEWAQRAPSASRFSKIVIGGSDQLPSSGPSSTFRPFMSLALAIDFSYHRLMADSSEFRRQISDASDRVRDSNRRAEMAERRSLEKEADLQRVYTHVGRLEFSLEQAQQKLIALEERNRRSNPGASAVGLSPPGAGAGEIQAPDSEELSAAKPATQPTPVSYPAPLTVQSNPSQSRKPRRAPEGSNQFRLGLREMTLFALLLAVVVLAVFVFISYRSNLTCMLPATVCGPEGEKQRPLKIPDNDMLMLPSFSDDIPGTSLIVVNPDARDDPQRSDGNSRRKK